MNLPEIPHGIDVGPTRVGAVYIVITPPKGTLYIIKTQYSRNELYIQECKNVKT